MADIVPNGTGGPRFKAVLRSYDIPSGARAQHPGARVQPSGHSLLNVRGTAILDQLAFEAGQSIERYNVRYEADEAANLVAVYVADEVGPGVLPARRTKKGRTVSIHMGGVFQEYPGMRPVGKRDCQVWRETDANGRPYMVVSLRTGLGTRTVSRSDAVPAPARTGSTLSESPRAEGAQSESPKVENAENPE